MNKLKRRRTRSVSVAAFAVSLTAYMAIGVVGASTASAAGTCSWAGGVLTVNMTAANDAVTVAQNTASGLIEINDGAPVACAPVAATVATTSIIVNGSTGDEQLTILMSDADPASPNDLISWGTINWTVNLGSQGSPAAGDNLFIDGGLVQGDPVNVVCGVSGCDLNNDGDLDVVYSGTESLAIAGGDDDDTLSAGGSTITGAPVGDLTGVTTTLFDADIGGNAGDDTITGGSANDRLIGGAGSDTVAGGLGDDTLDGSESAADADVLSYAGSATAVNANLLTGVATGEGFDTLVPGATPNNSFERLVGSKLGDILAGDDQPNRITPGEGVDTVDGNDGEADAVPVTNTAPLCDVVSYSDLSDGVTVDLSAGTVTGTKAGADVLTDIEGVRGTTGDDTLIDSVDDDNCLDGREGNDTFDQGADVVTGDNDSITDSGGIDTVDYSARTEDLTVNLAFVPVAPAVDTFINGDTADGEGDSIAANTIEDARLGTGDDLFTGSAFNNRVFPGGGQNSLEAGAGIDTVDYSIGYEAGATINLSGGGASGGGQDAIGGVENAVGTAFNDEIIGSDVVGGTNGANLLVGGKGSDSISGNAGPDSVRAGAGNDSIRGGAGDDTLEGQGGKDNIRGSGGADDIFGGKGKDFCDGGGGSDFIKTCEKPKHHGQGPNGPGLHQRI